MKITPRVALEIATHEGMVRQAYFDSVGKLTWSVGITSASGHSVERYIDNPQPMRKCIEVWLWLLEKYADDVRAALGDSLTEAQFAAALSFHWNTGSIGAASWVRKFKAGDMAGAEAAFMKWRKPAEIIPRRRAEADLLFRGRWSQHGKITEYTRVTPRRRPDWSSATRRDISADVEALLEPKVPVIEAAAPPKKPMGAAWAFGLVGAGVVALISNWLQPVRDAAAGVSAWFSSIF